MSADATAYLVDRFLRRQRGEPATSATSAQSAGGGPGGSGGGGGGGGAPSVGLGSGGVVGIDGGTIAEETVGSDTLTDYFNNSMLENFWWPAAGTWTETSSLSVAGLAGIDVPRGRLVCIGFGSVTDGESLVIPTANLNTGAFLRWDEAGNGYYATRNGAATAQLVRVDGFVASLPLVSGAYTAGQTLGVRAVGTTIELMVNGASVGSAIDATYASGYAGVGAFASGSTFSRFSVTRY